MSLCLISDLSKHALDYAVAEVFQLKNIGFDDTGVFIGDSDQQFTKTQKLFGEHLDYLHHYNPNVFIEMLATLHHYKLQSESSNYTTVFFATATIKIGVSGSTQTYRMQGCTIQEAVARCFVAVGYRGGDYYRIPIVTGKQIGRASCRERVLRLV